MPFGPLYLEFSVDLDPLSLIFLLSPLHPLSLDVGRCEPDLFLILDQQLLPLFLSGKGGG